MTIEERIQKLEQEIEQLKYPARVMSGGVMPKALKQQDIDGLIIFRGDVADLPTNGDTEIQAYYAEDEKKLYIWNDTNEAWESSSFT